MILAASPTIGAGERSTILVNIISGQLLCAAIILRVTYSIS